MTKIHNPAMQKDMRAINIQCTDCGHCIDLKAPSSHDPIELTNARTAMQNQIIEWLRADTLKRETELNFLQK